MENQQYKPIELELEIMGTAILNKAGLDRFGRERSESRNIAFSNRILRYDLRVEDLNQIKINPDGPRKIC
jgi:hypothetical protein